MYEDEKDRCKNKSHLSFVFLTVAKTVVLCYIKKNSFKYGGKNYEQRFINSGF